MVREEPEIWESYMNMVKYDFASQLGAHTSALLSYYPPGGFVGWHTNYDATAYQVLFTWSDGNGYFRYYDMAKDEVVTIQDVEGWQCRHYYFEAENKNQRISVGTLRMQVENVSPLHINLSMVRDSTVLTMQTQDI